MKKFVFASFFSIAVMIMMIVVFWKSANQENHNSPLYIRMQHLESDRDTFSQYAGSQNCKECHKQYFSNWNSSNHAKAERLPTSEDEDAFSNHPSFFHRGIPSQPLLLQKDGFAINTLAFEGKKKTLTIERVFGNEPLRQFLVSHIGGRIQALDLAWDPKAKEWFGVFDDDRKFGEWGHWTGRGMNWNSMCASCHNTRLRKNYDSQNDEFHTSMAEMAVGCEACHGPMKEHVLWQKNQDSQNWNSQDQDSQDQDSQNWNSQSRRSHLKDPTITRFTRSQILHTCGSCHSRRSELTGDFHPGESYFDHYHLTIPDASETFYPDGQVRDENYVFTSFLSSKMYSAGVHCLDCHDPHSTKTRLPGNALCLRCHNGSVSNSPKINPTEHSHHDLQSDGNQCVNCHMPHTIYMERHARRDHGFIIPDPLLTKQFGIPNACNRCHKDRDVDWALSFTKKWYGERMERKSRRRAQWFALAREGNEDAKDPLIELLLGDEIAVWKAGAAHLLSQWLDQPKVQKALLSTLNHTNEMLRAHGLIAISPLVETGDEAVKNAIEKLLDDPSRDVRIKAAWALRSRIDSQNRARQELIHSLDHNADQPLGQMQLGAFALAHERLDDAFKHYSKAVKWGAHSAPIRHDFAVVLSMLGRHKEALEELKIACQLEPEEAMYRYKLALAWNDLGNEKETLSALKKAVELNPQHGRAWYNLGLALSRKGEDEAALSALIRGESLSEKDPDIPYERAMILLRLGRVEEAEAAALRAIEIEPQHFQAQHFLDTLPIFSR